MELALVVWLIGILTSVKELFVAFVFMFLFAAFAYVFYCMANSKPIKKTGYGLIGAFFVSSFLAALIPTTQQGWLIAGAGLTQAALQTDAAKKFGKIVDLKLQEVLDEATEQAKIKVRSVNESSTEDKPQK